MKLLNHTLKYLVLILPLIIAVWAGLFYYNMVDEVEDSLDDGLENYKMLIIQQAELDSTVLQNDTFRERNYAIREITVAEALSMTDRYTDTLMYMINEEDFEPVRMLRTAFKQQDRYAQNRYYELLVISTSLERDDLIEDMLISIIWLYIVLLLSVLIINNLVLKKIWAPFYRLLDKIGRFSLDKNPVITPTPSKVREFQELDNRVVELARQSAATYAAQKQFLENAAHELQTPLAISINKLELLAEQEDLSGQHQEAIAQVTRNLQRLTRLNRALLLLTKIENRQFIDSQQLDVNELVRQTAEQFEDLAESREVNIGIGEEGSLQWLANPDLASILVSNLLKNALVHNIPGGRVHITLTGDRLEVANTGSPEALDTSRIFKRFSKNASDIHRIGLGLSIAQAICTASGLQISYEYRDGLHTFMVQ